MSKTKIPEDIKQEVRKLQNNALTNKAICYLTGEDVEEDDIEYDHVIPEAKGGVTDISNIRIVSKMVNRKKGTRDFATFKEILSLEKLFKSKNTISLQDLMDYKNIPKKEIYVLLEKEYAIINNEKYKLFYCDKTNTNYFFAKIDYEYITNDTEDGLQPRNIDIKKLLDLKDNFINRPQLQPSIARLKNRKVLLFDGQHKAGANLLNGGKSLELKVYIDDGQSDVLFQTLMITNLEAHNKFKQTGFASSILVSKMKNIADSHLEEYISNSDEVHSEKGYLDFLVLNKGFKRNEAESIIKNYICDAQIDSFGLKSLIVDRQSFDTSKQGISHNAFKKYFSARLCYQNLLISDFSKNERENENKNLSIITGMFLKHSKNTNPTFVKRFLNVYSLDAVTSLLRDLVIIICKVMTEEDRNKLLINLEIDSEMEKRLKKAVDYIYGHVLWVDESQNSFWRVSSRAPVIDHFNKNNLTIGNILKSIDQI